MTAYLAGTVDNHVEVVASVADDSVIHDGALLVHHQTELSLADLERGNVADNHLLDKSQCILSVPLDLTHVTHIKKRGASLGSSVNVLLQHSEALVLHGQGVTGEGNNLTTQTQVKIVESGLLHLLSRELAGRNELRRVSCNFGKHGNV